MILTTHLDYLRDQFVNTSWSNPSLETNITVTPVLVNLKFPAYGWLNFMRTAVVLPTEFTAYDVYHIQYIPGDHLRKCMQKPSTWVTLESLCSENNLLLGLNYEGTTFSGFYKSSYIQYLPNRSVLLAVPTVARQYRTKLTLDIRTSNDSHDTRISVEATDITTPLALLNWRAKYNLRTDNDLSIHHVNGVFTEPPLANVKIGDKVSVIRDESTKMVASHLPNGLPTYEHDGESYYLIPLCDMSIDTEIIYSRIDVVIYLVRNGIGNRLLVDSDELVQVTDCIVGLKISHVQDALDSIGWALNSIVLKVFSKEATPPQRYINNDNYLYSLNRMSDELRTRALTNVDGAPEVTTANYYHKNAYNNLLEAEYDDITIEALVNAISVSTWDSLVNRSVIPASDINTNITNLIPVANVLRPIYEYDVDTGEVLEWDPSYKRDTVGAFLVGYSKNTEVRRGKLVEVGDMMVPAVYSKNGDVVTLLKPAIDYNRIDDLIQVKDSHNDVYTLDMATTYIHELDPDLLVQDLPVSDILWEFGVISLIADNKTLTPDIDYSWGNGQLVIYYAEALTKLTMVFQPTLSPRTAIIETGFTRNGAISLNDTRLGLDPSNYYIIIGGQVKLPSQVVWDEPFQRSAEVYGNALPYAVLRVLLTNSDDDVNEVFDRRKVYEDNLQEIADYVGLHTETTSVGNSIYPESYRLVSMFAYIIYHDALDGKIEYNPISLNLVGLDATVEPYMYLLTDGIDVTVRDMEDAIIEVVPHRDLVPHAINRQLYNFIERINAKYLGNRIRMNNYFRITL